MKARPRAGGDDTGHGGGPAAMTTTAASTRERLLQAARELIDEGGYRATSVLAIAERAGVATGTLYRHFASKEDLFVEMFRDVCDHEDRAIAAALAGLGQAPPAVDVVEQIVGTFAQRALRNRRLAWALLAEPLDPRVDAERLAYRTRSTERIAAVLERGIEAGELPEQNVSLTAAAIVGACGEALVGPLSPLGDGWPGADEVVRSLRTFVRRAVGAASTVPAGQPGKR
jgi:AcrR family transcriptional regulator